MSINLQSYPLSLEMQDTEWSPPQTIPLYNSETSPPILVPDQNRTVHALSSQFLGEASGGSLRVIFYNRWTLKHGWTPPVDIIISPNREARLTDAHLDKNGILHVVFWGGDNTRASIYYSKALASSADDSQAWSAPTIIGEIAGSPETAVFAENDQGTLYVVYNGKDLGNGLYVVNSSDLGETWSDPSPIFRAQSNEPNISLLRIIKSNSGWLHAVWGVYNIGGQGRGIYYARSEDGNEWSEPVLLAEAQDGLGTHTPTIIEHRGSLIALYNLPPKITMRRSIDNGKTWQDSIVMFPRHVGVNGSLSPVIDSNDSLHLFFGQRISGSPDIHGMWHSVLVNNRWTEPEAIIKGPAIIDPVGNKSFDPYAARAVVIQGNVILVTWRTDPGLEGNGVWYSYKVIDAPELPVSLPVTQTSVAPTLTPASRGDINSPGNVPTEGSIDENPSLLRNIQTRSGHFNSGTLVAAGVIPALILLLVVIIAKVVRNRP